MNILKQLTEGLTTYSEDETLAAAQAFAEVFPINHTLALQGDLGAGKTTFIKGMAQAWGIEGPILSPTYNLYFTYEGTKRNLVHLDAYRLQPEQDPEDLLIEDFLTAPWCLAIEWPQNIFKLITPETWRLKLESRGDKYHVLQLQVPAKVANVYH
ncbi:MAG: tRNA (adenosine(37)-N6)-threonylcarbamoyltransferase complex ATPase subunit type 1 TsaE [Opitutae bacterium]|jgi:tRNA threonylcarbamoyladenosine biosynthesis protein TsaE|nr:tRNA (adenosine(37)-N6)-threonylcarbamoyltransferase complex ATPase subunit type 1 TsaE [Opitutae bacterium]MBT5693208.1 tRNA (adenosine(37)-N6)-threonylcarbamoyltransferase complex ATPase subunit type 1 TsaE [Opitutae bacterium]